MAEGLLTCKDQFLEKLEEACKQLNQTKAKETKMTNCNKL